MFIPTSTTAILALALAANAHVVMNTPRPYGFNSLENGPLDGDQFQFPCKNGGRSSAFDASGFDNPMTAGTNQLLNFTGSAVHGGGSCQLSVTYEFPPPKDRTKWKVIHTIIGGCPSNAKGNTEQIGSDAFGHAFGPSCAPGTTGECTNSFQFPLPKGLKNGKATIAWSWFNKIGNREMYMNCAPITVSGGTNDESFFNSLPQIFVANLPGECTTNPGILDIPNPGASIEHGAPADSNAIGSCAGAGEPPNKAVSSSPAASQTATPPPNNGGVFAPAASSTAPAPTTTSLASVATSTPTPTPKAENGNNNGNNDKNNNNNGNNNNNSKPPSANSPSPPAPRGDRSYSTPVTQPPTGAATNGRVPCPNPGRVICIGERQFGICNIDNLAVPQALSAGSKCIDGVIAKRDLHSHSRAHRRRAAGLRLRF